MFNTLKLALSSLAAHKLRAVLAMLGVFLGALALTGVQHVSKAMVVQAEQEVEKLGPNLFAARAGQVRFRRGSAGTSGASKTFTLADALALQGSLPGVLQAAPFVETSGQLRAGANKVPAQMVATWPQYPAVRAFKPAWGRFFTQAEEDRKAKVIVLGQKVASRLFGSPEAALGGQVFLFRAGFRVVGIMEPKGRDLSGSDQDEQVFVPLSTYMRRAANQDWISGVYMQLAKGTDVDLTSRTAEHILRTRRGLRPGQRNDFYVMAAKETMRLQQEALNLVQTLGIISASVSFAVGGLGILSIMTLMVRMRRVEIGVRRAIGARQKDIVRQFLLEAGVMSATGGALGVLAAAGLMTVVYQLGVFPAVYDPLLMAGSLLGSAVIGLLAGAYPAWEASRVQILDVLRN